MEHKTYQIFPKPVMRFKYSNEFSTMEKNYFYNMESRTRQNYGNKVSNDTNVFERPELSHIKKFCESALDTFLTEVYNPKSKNVKLKITQSWLNYTNKGEYHHTHSHSNSIVSGVFYINAKKEYDSILMQRGGHNNFVIFPNSVNDFITNEVDFKVETGELILFPSEVYHRVDVTKGEHQRISLAFNTFFEGELGYEPSLNYLKL